MTKNLNSLVWLEQEHPEVFEQYKQFSKERKAKRSKDFQKAHYSPASKDSQE